MQLQKLTPNLMVDDVETTLSYYTNVLGFTAVNTLPEKPPFAKATVWLGGSMLMFQQRLSLLHDYPSLQPGPGLGSSMTLYFDVPDVYDWHQSLKDKAQLLGPLASHDGVNEFSIRDCNGYILTFGQHLDAYEPMFA